MVSLAYGSANIASILQPNSNQSDFHKILQIIPQILILDTWIFLETSHPPPKKTSALREYVAQLLGSALAHLGWIWHHSPGG